MTDFDQLRPFRHGRGIPPLPPYHHIPRPYRKRYQFYAKPTLLKPRLQRSVTMLPFLNASLVSQPYQHSLHPGWKHEEVTKRMRRLMERTWGLEGQLKDLHDSL